MKERGLILAPDLRAKSRTGDKTNTRRAWKFQPPVNFRIGVSDVAAVTNGKLWAVSRSAHNAQGRACWPVDDKPHIKPQYEVGDLLYLQEPYQITNCVQSEQWVCGFYLDTKEEFSVNLNSHECKLWMDRKKPYMKTSSRFMYKSLARTWFKVTDVRVQRVKSITNIAAKAEGVTIRNIGETHYRAFKMLWDSVAKPGFKWADNPFVFVYKYERIEK